MEAPTPQEVVKAVCASLNKVGETIYQGSARCLKCLPVSAADILLEPTKYRIHSDVRVVAAIILRKHTLLPYSFNQHRAPTIAYIAESLKTSPRGIQFRMITMCELMRRDPSYRTVYVGAVRLLQQEGYSLHMTENVETAAPCQ